MRTVQIAFIGVLGIISIITIIGNSGPPKDLDPNTSSVGYLPLGDCMSGERYNKMVDTVVERTDWSQISNSAVFSASTKQLIGSIKVFDEMQRLGSNACPDLRPTYVKYLAAKTSAPTQSVSEEIKGNSTRSGKIKMKTDGNIRSSSSISSSVVRVARRGEILQEFSRSGSWVQVGQGSVEGWIAANLLGPE